jgi:cell division protein FtsN
VPAAGSLRRAAAAAALVAAVVVAAAAVRSSWRSSPSAPPAGPGSTAQTVDPKPALELEPALNPQAPADPSTTVPTRPIESPGRQTAILQSASAYELTVASIETTSRAASVAADLVKEGHPARVAASGRWQTVLVGPYSSLAEANEAKVLLERAGFSAIRITSSP